jgi:hypothetical protein
LQLNDGYEINPVVKEVDEDTLEEKYGIVFKETVPIEKQLKGSFDIKALDSLKFLLE